MARIVFVDVDTQYDFMRPDGRLYVPGAERLEPNLEKLAKHARAEGIQIVQTADAHYGTEEWKDVEVELKKWGGPFPMHCEVETPGQARVPATRAHNPLVVEVRELDEKGLARVLRHRGEIVLNKRAYTPFHNPNAEPILRGFETAVVYGVATDYCVREVVLGLRRLSPDMEILLVTDAIAPITAEGERRAMEEFAKAGVKLTTTREVLNRFRGPEHARKVRGHA